MMTRISILILALIGLVCFEASAQKERKFIRKGNGLFEEKNFENSEVEYRKALDKDAASFEAAFNLGDALYKQKKYEEALEQFQTLASKETDPQRLGLLHHNIGNTLLVNKKIDESIEAYKQSLRHFPNSRETKYNLEYARKMKEKEEEQKKKNQNQQSQDNKDNKDKKKDQDKKDQENKDDQKKKQQEDQKKDQDKKKDQKDKEKQKPEQGDQKDKKQPKPKEGKISKEDAQRLLQALENDEKKVQEKVQKAKAKAQKKKKQKIKKDW